MTRSGKSSPYIRRNEWNNEMRGISINRQQRGNMKIIEAKQKRFAAAGRYEQYQRRRR
jgi:hypothetical protein